MYQVCHCCDMYYYQSSKETNNVLHKKNCDENSEKVNT
jgi:hypothetical protein